LTSKKKQITSFINMIEDFPENVNELRGNPNALGEYLIHAAKNNPDAIRHKEIYEQFLSSDSWYLKKAAVFALLFVFKLNDKKYVNKAVDFLIDSNEDEEVRRWSISGLSVIYSGTKENKLLKIFYGLMFSKNEEPSVRKACIHAMMHLLGLSTTEIYDRENKIRGAGQNGLNIDASLIEFEREIDEAKRVFKTSEQGGV
jgi:hypothetical protein